MNEIAEKLENATKKTLFGKKPVFNKTGDFKESDLETVSKQVPILIPESFVSWLRLIGYGQINGELSIEPHWMSVRDSEFGPLAGSLSFAQDEFGNYLALNPSENWNVYYICHDPAGIALLSNSFESVISQLSEVGFSVGKLTERLEIDEDGLENGWFYDEHAQV